MRDHTAGGDEWRPRQVHAGGKVLQSGENDYLTPGRFDREFWNRRQNGHDGVALVCVELIHATNCITSGLAPYEGSARTTVDRHAGTISALRPTGKRDSASLRQGTRRREPLERPE